MKINKKICVFMEHYLAFRPFTYFNSNFSLKRKKQLKIVFMLFVENLSFFFTCVYILSQHALFIVYIVEDHIACGE